jgi:hypothetical protein
MVMAKTLKSTGVMRPRNWGLAANRSKPFAQASRKRLRSTALKN